MLCCLEGRRSFSQEMLARLIAEVGADQNQRKQEHAKALQQVEEEQELTKQVRDCYKQFCGWAEEFELAPLARKRVILSQLLEKVELGKGYQVTLHLKLTYRQFLDLTGQEKAP